jgi:undecaprenyl-diphosphatase
VRTALLAAVAVAAFVALGLLTHDQGAVGVDRAAFDVLEPLRGDIGLDVVRVITEIGSYPVVVLVGVAGAAHAARRGETAAALALAIGVLALIFVVTGMKEAWDRPRPEGRFYEPRGDSYPSGHSAYATVWISAAMLTGRRAFIALAALVAVTIGAARLYLHVHYLTDVLGGFALGTAVLAPVMGMARTRS